MKLKIYQLLIALLFALSIVSCNDEESLQEQPRQIVLLTDFSAGSDVVISMAGELKSRYPNTSFNYVEAAPFDVKEASYQLQTAAGNYPEGTFFVAIVEPGANAERMVFKTEKEQYFVVPDNSLSTKLFHEIEIPDCYKIENSFLCSGLEPDGLDFLDIYTSALFDLLDGRTPKEFGQKIISPEVFEVKDACSQDGVVSGQLNYTDNFGNCVSNIPENLLLSFKEGDLLEVSVGDKSFFAHFGTSYSSVPNGQNVMFPNGLNKLELAVNMGSLAGRYNIGAGTTIEISKRSVKIGLLHYSELSASMAEQVKERISHLGIEASYFEKDAKGNFNLMHDLIYELVEEGVDIIVPFSTPATQAAFLYTPEEIPLVYTIVTDPESAGILNGRGNITGLSDAPCYSQLLQFVKQILPNLNMVGSIFNNQESNSQYSQKLMKQNALLYQLGYVSSCSTSSADIPLAYNEVYAEGAQAILISCDNLMTNHCSVLSNLGFENSIPVIGTDVIAASKGALASLCVNYDKLCQATGDVVVSVICGQSPEDLPLQHFDTDVIAINKTSATKLGITIPEEILEQAAYVFE